MAKVGEAQGRVFVIRYAQREATRGHQFYGQVDREDEAVPLSYFVWLIETLDSLILVDTGFSAETAKRVGRPYLHSPRDAITALGFDPTSIDMVVLTHLHYDHAGTIGDFPNATIVIQEREMAFWTGRHAAIVASELGMDYLVLPEDVAYVVQANFAGRVQWVDGEGEIAPGVSVHHVGGHTPGMQVVRVNTALGNVVVASDATHFYENLECHRPYAVLDSVPQALDAFLILEQLATDRDLILPGHDPSVLNRFPSVECPDLAGHAVLVG